MNKTELIELIASDTGLSKLKAKKALESLINIIENSLDVGQKITIREFGTWYVTRREARSGRNPQTGQIIRIGAKKIIRFKPSNKLLEGGTGDGGPRSK